jgi:hypothetical protein
MKESSTILQPLQYIHQMQFAAYQCAQVGPWPMQEQHSVQLVMPEIYH